MNELLLPRRGFLSLGVSAALAALLRPLPTFGQEAPRPRARSLIVLWLRGGPSQLETFDPKPGTKIGGPTKALATRAKGVAIASLYPRLAAQMEDVSLIRSLVTPEGEHERGTYILRTGYRPVPTVVHPAFGSVIAHEMGEGDLPAHISLLDNDPPKAGLLGPRFDAFATGDPRQPLPDLMAQVEKERAERRFDDLDVVERAFAQGREQDAKAAGHHELAARARRLMASPAIKAFETKLEPLEVQRSYGETPFGRGCLAARRLVEQGVRSVEVVLDGWDTHSDNYKAHERLAGVLDPAFATLVSDLKQRRLLDSTLIVCAGEFGRTPRINVRDGRDHWPKGFSVALAGGGIKGGVVVGETDPEGEKLPTEPVSPGDLYATLATAFGLDPAKRNLSPAGRPVAIAEGKAVAKLLA